jgi:hypothetical protein
MFTEQDLNGTNSSDTILNPNRSTTNKVRYSTLPLTRIKKESMSILLIAKPTENNRDGPSNTSTR